MADDITQKLQEFLSNPEAQNMISSLLNTHPQSNAMEDAIQTASPTNEYGAGLQNILGSLNSHSDRRINLLNALKPYMSSSKASNIDKAIKMLKITQLSSILKDL